MPGRSEAAGLAQCLAHKEVLMGEAGDCPCPQLWRYESEVLPT
jgi:hypothetical protein